MGIANGEGEGTESEKGGQKGEGPEGDWGDGECEEPEETVDPPLCDNDFVRTGEHGDTDMSPEGLSGVSDAALNGTVIVEENQETDVLEPVDNGEDFEKDSKLFGIPSEDISTISQPQLERSDDSVGDQVETNAIVPLLEHESGDHPEGAADIAACHSGNGAGPQWDENTRREFEYVFFSQIPRCLEIQSSEHLGTRQVLGVHLVFTVRCTYGSLWPCS